MEKKMGNKNNISLNNQISEILESFRILDGAYKKEQIDDAIKLKDQITSKEARNFT